MENPFKFGGIVFDPYFADRQTEIATLTREISNLNRVFLVSPRRYGKSCLLFNLIESLKNFHVPSAYIDLNAHPTIESLAIAYATATGKALETNLQKLGSFFDSFKFFRPKATMEMGEVKYSMQFDLDADQKDALAALLESLAKAEMLAKKKKKRLAVFIDEFSDLSKYDGAELEKALRSEIQKHQHVAYVFSGSEQLVMLAMIADKTRAFYKLGRIMQLGPIPRNEYSGFIQRWFTKGGRLFAPQRANECLTEIFNLAKDVPYNVQRMCHNIWNATTTSGAMIDAGLVRKIPDIIATQDSPHFELIWRTVSIKQRRILFALAKTPMLKPFSKDFALTHRLSPPSSVKAALVSLRKKGLIYMNARGRYRFTDPFFKHWILLIAANMLPLR
jgi:hypothetical protein